MSTKQSATKTEKTTATKVTTLPPPMSVKDVLSKINSRHHDFVRNLPLSRIADIAMIEFLRNVPATPATRARINAALAGDPSASS
jgi:hypothetical protein